MFHVATVHWRADRWVDVQLRYLHRNLPEPFRVYAFLNGLRRDHSDKFFYSSTEQVKDHATKLNLLADLIGFAAKPDDPLVFIDGDAFPIAGLEPLAGEPLRRHELIAVRRAEVGDPQPHPCFCLTTVGFWKEIGGDWHQGHRWTNAAGKKVTDVGGNLLAALEARGTEWLALERSNRRDLHPLFFAIYGDVVYHHGGGFRPARGGRVLNVERGIDEARQSLRARMLDRLPSSRLTRRLRRRFHPVRRLGDELRRETATQSREVFERIQADEEFYRALIDVPDG